VQFFTPELVKYRDMPLKLKKKFKPTPAMLALQNQNYQQLEPEQKRKIAEKLSIQAFYKKCSVTITHGFGYFWTWRLKGYGKTLHI
jgi:hypothetical protein